MRRRLLGSPTVMTLAAFLAVFLCQELVSLVAGRVAMQSLFVLTTPVTHNPWTVVTSVYAHSGVSHLIANAVALAVVGILLERQTTPARFHAFFVVAGALSGLAEVWLAPLTGAVLGGAGQVSVLGGSGAVFALAGYLLTSNRLTDRVVGTIQLSPRLQLAAFAAIAVVVTLATARPQVALVAHFTGLLLGLVAGRVHVLRPRQKGAQPEPA
ncbi:rhomboid family intramembrane serine protease [Halomicrobium sp. LC1Hm]|uniref:rhomboid family intramembrane serine protease n=1 Tax=Halomicrobium sp. LC1Hm TaxID=2610902 RepID=UPI0012983AFD|nr:rhomboid family intramembrane serine protease [Halomicrobium sp. LC1Hm]QGA81295.1 Membrane associated serine protease [Halomicrobium sp. LC1Hm]